jgi:hypothetical protein
MKFLKWLLIIVAVLVLLGAGGLAFYDAGDWAPLFRNYKGRLEGAPVTNMTTENEMTLYDVELSSDKGRSVMCRVSVPETSNGKRGSWPAVILVAGMETGRKAIDLLPPQKNMMVIALDYPQSVKLDFSSNVATVRSVWAAREAAMHMVSCVLLAGDFVAAQAMVDKDRVLLAGIGEGAFICAAAAAADDQNQFSHVVMVQSGANIGHLIQMNSRRLKLPVAASTAGKIGEWLFKPLEPLRYIERIAPRPLTMLNGKSDAWMPAEAAQKLFDRAREPKKLIWLKGQHESPDDKKLIADLANRVLVELPQAGKNSAIGIGVDMMGR